MVVCVLESYLINVSLTYRSIPWFTHKEKEKGRLKVFKRSQPINMERRLRSFETHI